MNTHKLFNGAKAAMPNRLARIRRYLSQGGVEMKIRVLFRLAILMLTVLMASTPSNASSPSLLFTEDWESGTIDPAKWTVFGSPQPGIYPGMGLEGSYAVNNNGDGSYASGLFVPTAFDITQGIEVEFWLRGGGPIGALWSGNDVVLTTCSPDVNHETCGLHSSVAFVHTSAEDNKVFYVAFTASGLEQGEETWEPLSGGWHKYAYTITPDGFVLFYRDDELMFSTTAPIDFEVHSQAWLQIQGRSMFGAYYYVDDLSVREVTMPVVQAEIDLDPDTLNPKSKGKWITAYIELPDGYDVADIYVNAVTLEGTIPAENHPTEAGDYDTDGIPDLMVKFDRQALIEYLDGMTGEVTSTVSGELGDGTTFEGSDIITVIPTG
jgi:hypothetical protein